MSRTACIIISDLRDRNITNKPEPKEIYKLQNLNLFGKQEDDQKTKHINYKTQNTESKQYRNLSKYYKTYNTNGSTGKPKDLITEQETTLGFSWPSWVAWRKKGTETQ